MDRDDRVAAPAGLETDEERIAFVQHVMDAFNGRDLDALVALAGPDFEYDWTRSMGPLAGVYRGPEGFMEFVHEQWSMFDEFSVEGLEYIPRGNHVVVPTKVRATGRSGVPVSAMSAHLYTFENGRIVRITLFQERGEALAAAT
jgi:ketosteroid isomerase-like protein